MFGIHLVFNLTTSVINYNQNLCAYLGGILIAKPLRILCDGNMTVHPLYALYIFALSFSLPSMPSGISWKEMKKKNLTYLILRTRNSILRKFIIIPTSQGWLNELFNILFLRQCTVGSAQLHWLMKIKMWRGTETGPLIMCFKCLIEIIFL